MNKELRIKGREGNLLVESIVAISVVLVGFLGVLGLLSRSLGLNKDVSQKFIATYLAAEGIEVVKSLIDKDFVNGDSFNETVSDGGPYEVGYDSTALISPASGNPLLFNSTNGGYNYSDGVPSLFTRVIEISELERNGRTGTDEIKVVSRVEWQSRGGLQTVELEDHFFDWR